MVKKRRRKKKSNKYFTKVHENAILDFVASTDDHFRNEIYRDVIRPAFKEMINKIVFTYKFTTLPNVDSLKDECEMHLVTILVQKRFLTLASLLKTGLLPKLKKQPLNSGERRTMMKYLKQFR